MNCNVSGIGVRRLTRVVPGIGGSCVLYAESGHGGRPVLRGDPDPSSGRVVVDHAVVVEPEHEHRRGGALGDDAR